MTQGDTHSQQLSIGVVVPAYNEASVIAKVLQAVPSTIGGHPITVIVVDDGSKDKTAEEASKTGAIVISHIINMGAGAATRTGIHYASKIGCDIVATMDADGQHRSEDLKTVIHAVLDNEADVVIGSRLLQPEGMVLHRLIGNVGLSTLTYLIFGVKVADSQSGLKAFNASAIDKIEYQSNDYAFCSEMLWRAKQQGLTISEVPIKAVYSEYSLSKGQSRWNGINMVAQMLRRRIGGLLNE